MRHDLIIFDCDGVLVDSERVSNQCLLENLGGYGLTLTLEDCLDLFVGGTMAEVEGKARRMGAMLPEGWLDQINAEIHDRLRQGVPVIKGIPELLDHADSIKLAYCVASNGSLDKMRITLGQTGLWSRFEGAMFSAYEVGISKPDPGLFQLAAARFGARRPVVIEDSYNGVLAARRAGMRCMAYVPHGGADRLSGLEAELFDDMNELPALLAG